MMEFLDSLGGSAILLRLCIMSICAFLFSRVTKLLKMPNVTGYILCGIVIGPYVTGVISQSVVESMEFVTDIALAFIAFGVGRYMKLSNFKANFGKTAVITLFETLITMTVITLIMIYVFKLDVPFSLLIGAIGGCTAPASTIMNIRQLKAKGDFVKTVVQVIAMDNLIAIIAFSITAAIVQASTSGGTFDTEVVLVPLLLNMIGIAVGVAVGFLLSYLIKAIKAGDSILVVTVAIMMIIAYVCSIMDISPLLSSMAAGITYINVSGDKKLYKLINQVAPPILMLFFVTSGMKLEITMLSSAGLIGLVYFAVRIIVKYISAYFGSTVTRSTMVVRRYLGLALIPQAGVSIGLCALATRMLPEQMGSLLSAVILSSAILYEIVGPVLSKASFYLSGSVKDIKKKSENVEECIDEENEIITDTIEENRVYDTVEKK
ncbi:MAG: cation:proton antiporter [Clostridia bacterium]|nr:cation:proton antiporter [Clostridia bacterium]